MAEETIEALRLVNAELREKLALAERTRDAAQAASSRDLTDARFVRIFAKHAAWLPGAVEAFVLGHDVRDIDVTRHDESDPAEGRIWHTILFTWSERRR